MGPEKTTASMTLLPEVFESYEFVNADMIAAGISPLRPESGSGFEAGRIMLKRINELLKQKLDFAFETTLATRSYVSLINKAKKMDYEICLLFLWTPSFEFSIKRVALRVSKGGHHIPDNVVERRYHRGLNNFFNLYTPIVDRWMMFDNTENEPTIISEFSVEFGKQVKNNEIWNNITQQYESD